MLLYHVTPEDLMRLKTMLDRDPHLSPAGGKNHIVPPGPIDADQAQYFYKFLVDKWIDEVTKP